MITANEAKEISMQNVDKYLKVLDENIRGALSNPEATGCNSITVDAMYPLLQKKLEELGYSVRLKSYPPNGDGGWIIMW